MKDQDKERFVEELLRYIGGEDIEHPAMIQKFQAYLQQKEELDLPPQWDDLLQRAKPPSRRLRAWRFQFAALFLMVAVGYLVWEIGWMNGRNRPTSRPKQKRILSDIGYSIQWEKGTQFQMRRDKRQCLLWKGSIHIRTDRPKAITVITPAGLFWNLGSLWTVYVDQEETKVWVKKGRIAFRPFKQYGGKEKILHAQSSVYRFPNLVKGDFPVPDLPEEKQEKKAKIKKPVPISLAGKFYSRYKGRIIQFLLKSKEKITGEIIGYKGNRIRLKTNAGILMIPAKEVEKVQIAQ